MYSFYFPFFSSSPWPSPAHVLIHRLAAHCAAANMSSSSTQTHRGKALLVFLAVLFFFSAPTRGRRRQQVKQKKKTKNNDYKLGFTKVNTTTAAARSHALSENCFGIDLKPSPKLGARVWKSLHCHPTATQCPKTRASCEFDEEEPQVTWRQEEKKWNMHAVLAAVTNGKRQVRDKRVKKGNLNIDSRKQPDVWWERGKRGGKVITHWQKQSKARVADGWAAAKRRGRRRGNRVSSDNSNLSQPDGAAVKLQA